MGIRIGTGQHGGLRRGRNLRELDPGITELVADNDTTPTRFVASSKNVRSKRSSPENQVARRGFATTRRPTRVAMSLSVASAT
jgi:hypothetical protein